MLGLLAIVVALPFLGFLILALAGRWMPRVAQAITGVGSMSLAAILTILIGIDFISNPPANGFFEVHLWQWFNIGGLAPDIAFHLDAMSLVFIFVITFVGALIHLYSVEFMWKEEEGFGRFFAYMNLFVGSMLTLVLANNLLLLYLGWEGVGLCSYLLIGFWYKDPANGYAARKAFIVTRVGDTAMAIGLFILFMSFGTLNIQDLLTAAPGAWQVGSGIAVATALLLLGGAVGKSAQLPLQTWLPDAMAGPSPVSALIHAATMVTAGVYLIARMHTFFELAPLAQHTVAIIGAATLLLAGFSALKQHDIKRVLAYSTISQIGYMFLALGVGAWSAAVFHFMIHAFFKALLFLGAGAIILVLHHEHSMFKMGGLRKKMPVIFWTYLIASASLAALPLVTAGFYSKDQILWLAYSNGNIILWLAGAVGALLTAIYTFRMVFITFFGEAKTEMTHKPGMLITIPLVILGVLSIAGGFIELPSTMGHVTIFSDFVGQIFPHGSEHEASFSTEILFQAIAAALALGGLFIAYTRYYNKPLPETPQLQSWENFLYKGWQFDALYDRLFVRPVVWLSRINKNDFIDRFYDFLAWLTRLFHSFFSLTQNGQLRWYAVSIVLGAIIALTIILYL